MTSRTLIAAGATALAAVSANGQTKTESMSFEDCIRVIQKTAAQVGVAPINIVETDVLRIFRFPATDGSVLVSCSRPDRKMVMQFSPKK